MIKVYGMPSCPDCAFVKEQLLGREAEFDYVDIGSHVRLLKEFLQLRDHDPAFAEVKKHGKAGIPCFLKEDGSVTLDPEAVGLLASGRACSLADHLAGKKGC